MTAKRDPKLTERARAMRLAPSLAEERLWPHLRRAALGGHRFTRQLVVGRYIADFACRRARLIVELDGDSHAERERHDARRTAFLQARGYRMLRFSNAEVHEDVEAVAEAIWRALEGS